MSDTIAVTTLSLVTRTPGEPDDRVELCLTGKMAADVLVDGERMFTVKAEPAGQLQEAITFSDRGMARRFAEKIAAGTVAAMREMTGPNAVNPAVFDALISRAVLRAMGCTCARGAYYAENLNCTLHGKLGALPVSWELSADEPR